MKRADLVTGQHYAYCTRRELSLSWTTKVELLDTQLYTRSNMPGPDRGKVKLAENQSMRPTNGAGYYGSPYGLLAKMEDGKRSIILPQNLHMTWENFLAWKAEREAENAKAAAKHTELRKSQAAKARELREALAAIDMAGKIMFTTDRNFTAVDNDVLLEILRRAAANESLAAQFDETAEMTIAKREFTREHGNGSTSNMQAIARHDGKAEGIRWAAAVLRGTKR